MKNKVSKYLSSKEKSSYTQLDILFKMYIDEKIEKELSCLNFYDIEIFAYCNKGIENSIQINFKYYNLACIIDFFNKGIEYVVYSIGDSFEQVKDSFIEHEYEEDFSLYGFISLVYNQMKEHPNLKDNTQLIIKQKKYKMIANMCLIIPCVIIGISAIYVLVSKNTLILKPFYILAIVIPIVLWLIFYAKSAKSK